MSKFLSYVDAAVVFVLMGQFAYHSGMSRDIYEAVYKWEGYLPGGLGIATMSGCAGFAAICGSSLVTSATGTWGILMLFALVTGGIYAGAFTPIEAAGLGASGALVISVLRKQVNFTIILKCICHQRGRQRCTPANNI